MKDVASSDRSRRAPRHRDEPDDPAVVALLELIQSERARAALEEPELVERVDSGRVWLLWFAIGATDAVCSLVQRDATANGTRCSGRSSTSSLAASACVPASTRCKPPPAHLELLESAGSEAVQACMRGEKRLGYYLEALRVGSGGDF